MLAECMEVFKRNFERDGIKLILDSYIPADGTYLLIDAEGGIKTAFDIRIDKKTGQIERNSQFFDDILRYDYYSQLVSMNKPMDIKKIIHSNNYLAFWVKKESIVSGKLTEEIIDGYYDILKDPLNGKYQKSKEASRIYRLFEQTEGTVDQEKLEWNRAWIKEHIFSLEGVDLNRKDYLKIYFETDEGNDAYERESRRYFLPNIYNSNEYNVELDGVVYGLPDNNLGMNAKKPFLSIKSRKNPAPYLLDGQEAMLQKQFFDYLLGMASVRKCNVYIDTDAGTIRGYLNGEGPDSMDCGYYLRIKKGKNEAEIQNQDNIAGYHQHLKRPFTFRRIVGAQYKMHKEYEDGYKEYTKRNEIGQLINEVLFSNYLAGNYYTEPEQINIRNEVLKKNIVMCRNVIFDWVYKGIDRDFSGVLERISQNLIKSSLLMGYRERALWQMDLRYSLREYFSEGGGSMKKICDGIRGKVKEKVLAEETAFPENDEEYFYAVGQLAAYLFSLNKGKDRNQSLLNSFLNARTDKMIKTRMLQLYKKYNYAISERNKRVKNLLAMVMGYVPEQGVKQDMIVLGYASDNLIYFKEEK